MKWLVIFLVCNLHVTWSRIVQTDDRLLLTEIQKISASTGEEESIENPEKVVASHIVGTSAGPIRGRLQRTTRDNVEYASFVGIPYGKAPVGKLRFKSPQPASPWTEVRDAVQEGHSCETHEDCLVLNVFTPVLSAEPVTSPKAVLVFIHGGAFTSGSSRISSFSPDFWIDKDVIFVTLNYRLGPLGFLSLQNADVPGNAGLKDQLLAMKWIKKNIDKFGGDPERIILFGQSAGSASVAFLQLSPAAKGLFSGVILESGTAMQSWSYTEPDWAVQHAFRLGRLIGCNVTDGDKKELLDCLTEADWALLSSTQFLSLTFHELWILHFFAFVPTVEPDVNDPDAIITKTPFQHLSTGDFNHVPVVLGFTSMEATMIYPILYFFDPTGFLQYEIGKDMSRFVPYELNITHTSPQAPELEQMIKDAYFDGDEMTLKHRTDVLDLGTDTHFAIDIQRVALLLAQNSKAPVWNYRFSYDGPFSSKNNSISQNIEGVSHGGELGYLMNSAYLRRKYNEYQRDSRPQLMIDQMTEMWTNFAKYGNPTPDLNGYMKVEWKSFTKDEHNYLEIDEEISLEKGLKSERMKVWNDIYEKVDNRRPLPE